jgi:transposase-like protein
MIVIGIRSRDGKVKSIAMPKLQSHKLKQILKKYIQEGNILYTDNHSASSEIQSMGLQT